MGSSIPSYLLERDRSEPITGSRHGKRFTFLDRTLHHTAKTLKTLYVQAESAGTASVICRLHPLTKVLSFLYLIVIMSLVRSPYTLIIASAFIFICVLLSGIRVGSLYRKVLALAFFFGFLIFVPATLNVITPGDTIVTLVRFEEARHFWIYTIPKEITLTWQGARVVMLLFLRVFNSVTLALLLAHTTAFPDLLKALRTFRVPNTLLMVIWLAYKFIFILCRTIDETYHAMKSRMITNVRNNAVREIIAGRVFFIYHKAQGHYEQTWAAMISRGYDGKVHLSGVRSLPVKEYFMLAFVAAFGVLLMMI